MTITHHPDLSTLMTCSAGATPEALCAVVASHLSMCPQCMAELSRLEQIGIALFTFLEPAHLDKAAPHPNGCAKPADGHGHSPTNARKSGANASCGTRIGDVPAPLVERVGPHLESLPWSKIAEGIWHSPVRLSPAASGDLRFVRLAPGATLPPHRHVGEELTLVLAGAYEDETGIHGVGDFCDVEDETSHAVRADPELGCIMLVASETVPAFLPDAAITGRTARL